MTPPPPAEDSHEARGNVAKGAGMAFMGRAGAIIEAVNQPVFTRLFGLATYGLYITLWSYVRISTTVADYAMTTALQRYGAGAKSEHMAHAVLRLALILSTGIAVLIALLTTLCAPLLAGCLNVAEADRASLSGIIALYAWSLPLWTFVEVSTAAIRARRAFGPEIRVRIFYEQGSRLIFALAAFGLGWRSYGLFAAHLASLSLTAVLCLRLIVKQYNFKLLLSARLSRGERLEILHFGGALMPANLIKRMFADLPPVLLNLLLPGAAGAQAAGLYGIARKISSVLQIVSLSFEYVLAPLTAAHAHINWATVNLMYSYAIRLATLMILPLAGAVIALKTEIAGIFGEDALAAASVIVILTLGRCAETLSGPSSAVLEVVGLKRLPVLINFTGLAIGLGLASIFVPDYGAAGMAAGMATGLNIVAWTSLYVLHRNHRLSPYDATYARAFITGLGALALIILVAALIESWRFPVILALVLTLYPLEAYLGLPPSDRQALKRRKKKKAA